MFAHFAPHPHAAARRLLIWLMALALLVYGHSSSIVQMLGPAHRHATVAQPGTTAWLDGVAAAFQDMRAWRDSLHERLLPGEEVHGHPHPHDTSLALDDPRARPGAHVHGAGIEPQVHAHFHSLLQRHHHDPQDPSLVTLERDGPDPLADASAQAGAGSASLAMGLAAAVAVPSPVATPMAWNRDVSDTWADALPRLLERPPRA